MLAGFFKKKKTIDCALVMAPIWGIQNPPLGLAFIKSMLSRENYSVKCFDFNIVLYHILKEEVHWNLNYPGFFHEKENIQEANKRYGKIIDAWVKNILDYNPKIIGFSVFQSSALLSLVMAQKIKKINKHAIIFCGGLELNENYRTRDQLGIYFECGFDYVLTRKNNEIVQFCDSVIRKKGLVKNVPGIVYKKGDTIEANTSALDKMNILINLIPDYSDFRISMYKDKDCLPVNFSYGCTNKCNFCMDPLLWEYYASKKGEQMYKEIKHYTELYPKIKHFHFTDSLINGNHRELEKFCDLVISNKLDISWNAKARFDKRLTLELLSKIKQSGCTNLDFGLESGSQRVLDEMNKQVNLEDAREVLANAKKAGLDVICFVMIGYPTETEEDFQMTLDFIIENKEKITRIGQTTCCYVVKPSLLYDKREEYHIVGGPSGWSNEIVNPEIRKERSERFIRILDGLYGHKHEVQIH